jgi:organic hydroperoxide reductase OsmC/OhrA
VPGVTTERGIPAAVDTDVAIPKEMGGAGGATNPEVTLTGTV